MGGNRKKTETYRFNGNPFLHEGSIHSVEIAELEDRIKTLQAKLDDPNDLDDPKWTKRWLDRFEKELNKKLVARDAKSQDKLKRQPQPERLDFDPMDNGYPET